MAAATCPTAWAERIIRLFFFADDVYTVELVGVLRACV